MKSKILSIIAVILGCLCIAYTVWVQYVAVSIAAVAPYAVGNFDSRYFWWPICGAVVFWTLAGFGFISRRKHGRDQTS